VKRQDAVNFLKELQFSGGPFSTEAIVLLQSKPQENFGLVIKTVDNEFRQAIDHLVEKYGLTLENFDQEVVFIGSKRKLDET
jgi:hypothetical protein